MTSISEAGHTLSAAPNTPRSVLQKGLATIDTALNSTAQMLCAVLLATELCLLLAGVVARYFFHNPLHWSDELATTLFLWLVMLGSVIAMRRGEHMRLNFIASKVSAAWQVRLAAASSIATAVFFAAIIPASVEHTINQWIITTPSLQIPDSLRVAAVPVGAILMLLVCLVQIARTSTWSATALAVGAVVVVAGLLWVAKPALGAMGNYNLIIFFALILSACVAMGMPIAVAFGISTLSYMAFVGDLPFSIAVGRIEEGISTLVLLSVPLFVFLGVLIEMTGIAGALVGLLVAALGHVRGGLSYVLVAAMYLVSGISGSKAADMAAIAPALAPEMRKRGAKKGEIAALLAASGAMSETIPPSLVLITIGSVTGVSIAALFAAGIVPAILLAACLAVVIFVKSRNEETAGRTRARTSVVGRALIVALPALLLPLLIRLAVVEGVATATEVSTLGVVYAVFAGLVIYRKFDWGRLYPMLVNTAALTGAILLIIGTATAMAWALTQSGFSQQLVSAMSSMPGGAWGFMAVSVVVFVILGSLLEGIPAIVLFGPLLFPAARALGIDEVHYAIVVIVAMGVGLFAPPFGVGYYIACAIGQEDPETSMSQVWAYLSAIAVGLVVLAAFPVITIGSK